MHGNAKKNENKFSDELYAAFSNHQYILLEKIGEGGFSIVFKARNRKTNQQVAIKILKSDVGISEPGSKNNLERFNNEIGLCAQLNHPNIVTLLDIGEIGDHQFSVFEFVSGHSLKDELFYQGTIAPITVLDIMSQLLKALSHAHQCGIIHRDIKPANIMLSKQGTKTYIKLLDFGIGAQPTKKQSLSNSDLLCGETTGTLSYVAPEQLRGELPTPKSDIYAWGLVFIECLTGIRIMSGACLSSIIQRQLCLSDITLPSTIEQHPISQVLKMATKKAIDKRIGSAEELYEKLSCIDLSDFTLPKSNTLSANDKDSYSHINKALQTLIHTNLVDNGQQATALCITLALQCDSNAQQLLDEQTEDNILQTLYEEKKNQCISVAQRYGATLSGRLVDTLLFYFGYPNSCNADSLICTKAAMAMARALNQPILVHNNEVKVFCTVHVGIHSGSFWPNRYTFPEGEIPRTAMTLARSAGANQILCSRPTLDILSSQAYFETTPVKSLYGYKDIPTSYAIIRERGETTVDSLRFKTDLLPLIGHENELERLKSLVAPPTSSVGSNDRCAHIYGEGGIGKSRILAELCLQRNDLAVWSLQCEPQNNLGDLSVILKLIKRMYGLNLGSEDKIVTKIQSLLQENQRLDPVRSTAILCSWLNLAPHEEDSTCPTAPKSSKRELFEILTFLLCNNNAGQLGRQALFIVDDMHWLDKTSLAFIGEFISSKTFRQSGHALITCSRQSLPSILYGQIRTVLKVSRLNRENAMALISASLSGQFVSKPLADLIVQRTDGIPLFIIEFVRMVKENKWDQRLNGKISLIEPHNIPLIPYTLRDLLEKRLDELTCDMRVVQFASAIGKEFGYEALKASVGPNTLSLNTTLDELLKRDLICVKRHQGKKAFMFKHELLRDAAYNSMSDSLQQEAQKLIYCSRMQPHRQKALTNKRLD